MNISPETPSGTLKWFEQSASESRIWAWFSIIVSNLSLALMVIAAFKDPSFVGRVMPLYWFLFIWLDVHGAVMFYLYRSLTKLKSASLFSVATIPLINRARKGLWLFVACNIGFFTGFLIFAPQAAPFTLALVITTPRLIARDRDNLLLLEDEISKNISQTH